MMNDSQEGKPLNSPSQIFNCQEVKRRMHEILHANLHDQSYDSNQCTSLVKHLASAIKDALKAFGYERYKFIIHIILSQEQNDSLQLACRSYWDSETDRFAQSVYINPFLICVATAFAVFYY